MIEKLREMEVVRQEMKRKAFEGYFKNTEIYNRECHLRKADILETWSEHLGYYSNIIAHESLLMWQAAQEQMLREQAEEAAQPNAFLSAVADMAIKLSSGDYALAPKEPTFQMYQAFKDAEDLEVKVGRRLDLPESVVKSLGEVP